MDNTTSDIPRDVADLIVDLKIIAGIPTNSKLNTLTGTYVDADSKYDGFWRWIDREKRNVTIDHINKKIDQAIEVCRKYPIWANVITKQVSEISNALINLEQTYQRKKDQITVGKISLIKLRIDEQRFMRACRESSTNSQLVEELNLNKQ